MGGTFVSGLIPTTCLFGLSFVLFFSGPYGIRFHGMTEDAYRGLVMKNGCILLMIWRTKMAGVE